MFNETDNFEIKIEFSPSSGDPARVFKAMSDLIDSFKILDQHLVSSVDLSLDVIMLLEDVERGSLRAKFRNVVEGLPDELIKDGEWKKVLGYYLLKAKEMILNWCAERDRIDDRNLVKALETGLFDIARETDIKALPAYAPIPTETLLSDIRNIQESLAPLTKDDRALYLFDEEQVEFNQDLEISNEIVREVLTREIVKTSGKRILKVKKPDYLGQSMWEFVYDTKAIDAKITDQDWLIQFQNRAVDIKPGDSVSVLLYEEISYGYEGEVVHRHYEIEKVYDVHKPPSQRKIDI